MKPALYILLLTSFTLTSNAQERIIEKLTAFFSDENIEREIDHFEDVIIQLTDAPLNINSCSDKDLENTGLFTAFQAYNIIQYREKYGEFLSLYELASIPGLTREFIQLVEPLLSVLHATGNNYKRKTTGFLLSNISIRTPQVKAFSSSPESRKQYIGSPIKQTHRIKGSENHLTAALTIEKDPGEVWLYQHKAEHLTGYLKYNQGKVLDEVILGNFKLHNGLGLVHGLGFDTKGSGIQTNGFRKSYAIPFSSTTEYDYYRGLFTAWKIKNIQTSIYLSSKPEDISLFRFNISDDLFERVKKTGYHRTKGEIESSGFGNTFSTGISVNLIGKHGNMGASYFLSHLSLTQSALDSLMIPENVKSKRSACSVYGVYHKSNWETFFELAIDRQNHHALLAGGRLVIHPALSAYGSLRNYATGFKGLMPSAYGTYNHPENTAGINIGFQIVPFKYSRLSLDADVSKTKNLFQTNSPFIYNLKNYATLSLSKNSSSVFEVRIKNIPEYNTGSMINNQEARNTIQFKYSKEFENKMIYETKYVINTLSRGKRKGTIIYQQISSPSPGKIKIKYRFMVFNIPDYESRIYLYEPGLKYSFLFPAWQGNGTQNILILRAKPFHFFSLACKFSMTRYGHRHNTGTGENMREGSSLYSFEVQIQADLH